MTTTYTYDAENVRLSAETDTYIEEYITDTVSSSLSKVLTATRYEKSEDADDGITLDDGVVTLHLYGSGLISETRGNITLYHHYNHLGSTTKLTDADGAVVETYTYGTYGELLSGDATLTRFLYNGKMGVSTDDNGLFYMRQRYYNPEIKRFVNQDILAGTLDNSQSLNRYCYVQGNPVSYVDPFGLSPMDSQEGRHMVLGLWGCIPGPIGMVANAIDAYWYFQEGDIGMATLSVLGALSGGLSSWAKLAGTGADMALMAKNTAGASKLAQMSRTAQKVSLACDLAGSGYSFLKEGTMAVENGGNILEKLKNGEKVSGAEWAEFGTNVAGMALSGFVGYSSAQGLKDLKQLQFTSRMKESVEGLANRGDTGLEVYYRTMSQDDYDYLRMTGEVRATGETHISPTEAFSRNYDGIMVRFEVNAGTKSLLEKIGLSNGDRASLAREIYPDMPYVSGIKWTEDFAFFKAEGSQINIGLGKGKALEIFNSNIINFSKVEK